ncbi:hypothetical protein [uncultured Kordia sp.]|uniref:hypothetical protein n=1 Tax=uncultured Kordia sp. TaxID=507699 RepID=UPI002636FAE0|nr:hypothetical protein [uncultured Kordia sp.]
MTIKLTNSKDEKSLNALQNTGRLQIKKGVYNKAFKTFIVDKYGSGIHFGNMNSNLEEILKNLSLDHLIEGKVKLPRIDVNTLSVVKNHKNEFSDFDLYENFECTFLAKEGISSKEFMKGIEILQTNFLEKYNQKVHEEITEIEHKNRIQIKRREIKEIIFFTVIFIIALTLIYFRSKR